MKKCISLITALTISLFSFSSVSSNSVCADTTEPVEILSLRSEYGKHFVNGDGTRTAYISTAPIHYLENGEWNEINNSLIMNEKREYTNISNPLKVTLPSEFTSGDNSSVSLVKNEYSIQIPFEDFIINLDDGKECVEATIKKSNKPKMNQDLPKEMLNSFDNSVSCISYDFDNNNKELSFEIHPDFIIENVAFDKSATIPATISFPIKTENLNIKTNDEGNLEFTEPNGTLAFTMIAPVVYDSSDDYNCSSVSFDVSVEDDECYLTLSIGDAINALNDPVYPLILSTEYTEQISANTRYNSEMFPNDVVYDQYMRIGNVDGNGFQTYVSCNESFYGYNYTGNIAITDATFNMYLVGNYLSSPKMLQIYSMNTQPMNVSWNNDSTLNNYNTHISDFNVAYTEMYSWKEVDITSLVQSWINYGNTSQNVGVASYGFKMITESTPKATVVANSERASYNHPYFEISYVVDSDYTLTYAPHKYDNITYGSSNIYNFQKRMNCYAYALQIYDRGSSNNSVNRLNPGEIGLLQNGSNYTITQLRYDYNHAQSIDDFMNFTEQQMFNDSTEMNTNLTKINLANDNQFVLPTSFNESTQRIIAMNAATRYYNAPYSMPSVNPPYDFHFYLRHGNGTCPIHNDGICSMWSHKVAEDNVSNKVNGVVLCDANIATQAKLLVTYKNGIVNNYSQTLRFYTIEQDTNVYDSWYIYINDQTPMSYNN